MNYPASLHSHSLTPTLLNSHNAQKLGRTAEGEIGKIFKHTLPMDQFHKIIEFHKIKIWCVSNLMLQ